jgi:hypothetical protein
VDPVWTPPPNVQVKKKRKSHSLVFSLALWNYYSGKVLIIKEK